MHPNIIRSEPGNCPICGMPLVKRAKSAQSQLPAGVLAQVQLTPLKVEMGRISTAPVEYRLLSREIRTVGIVDYDETRQASIAARVKGRIDNSWSTTSASTSAKGDPLASIYSPDLLVAQEELLAAVRSQNQQNAAPPRPSSRKRISWSRRPARNCSSWALPTTRSSQIIARDAPDTHLTIYSPIAGIVTEKAIVQGPMWMRAEDLHHRRPEPRLDAGEDFRGPDRRDPDRHGRRGHQHGLPRRNLRRQDHLHRLHRRSGHADHCRPRRDRQPRLQAQARHVRHRRDSTAGGQGDARHHPGRGGRRIGDRYRRLDPGIPGHRRRLCQGPRGHGRHRAVHRGSQGPGRTRRGRFQKQVAAIADAAQALQGKDLQDQRTAFKSPQRKDDHLPQAVPAVRHALCTSSTARWPRPPGFPTRTRSSTRTTARRCPPAARSPAGSPRRQPVNAERFATGYLLPDLPRPHFRQARGLPDRQVPDKFVRVEKVLAVPESAVIDTGTRKVVYRESAPGTFDMIEVNGRPAAGEFYPVLTGLKAGDRVATAGAFLVDAENRLNPAAAAQYFGAAVRRHRRQQEESASALGAVSMIPQIIEYSVRNRFIVLLIARWWPCGACTACLKTPIDAIPDLSENQVIVFTDWMGRCAAGDRRPDHLSAVGEPAGAGRREGGPVVERVQLLDDQHHLRRQDRLLLRPHARAGAAERGQHVPAAGRRALPGPGCHRPGPDLLVHGRGRRQQPRRAAGHPGLVRALPALRARRGRGRQRRRLRPRVPDRRRSRTSCAPTTCRWAASTPPSPAATSPSAARSIFEANAEYLIRGVGWLQGVNDLENVVVAERNGVPIYVQERGHGAARARSSAAACWRRTAARPSAAWCMMRYGENPLDGHQGDQGTHRAAAGRPARRACGSCRSTTARG